MSHGVMSLMSSAHVTTNCLYAKDKNENEGYKKHHNNLGKSKS